MLNIDVDRKSDQPLCTQIRDAIQGAIERGDLKVGAQLPTVNALASQVGVAQSTIRRALEDLVRDGHVESQVGRGTFVLGPEEQAQSPSKGPGAGPRNPADPAFRSAARRMRSGITKSLETLLSLNQRAGLIDFTGGMPGPGTVKPGTLAKAMNQALKESEDKYQFCSNDPMGILPLREHIAQGYCDRGLEVHPEQVMITNGAQQAVSLLALHTRDSGRRFICETPCFTGISNAFGTLGHWVEHVPRDEEGPEPERLLRFSDQQPSTLYLCPMVQNPMGTDLSAQRRKILVNWAQKNRALVISDELFDELRFEPNGPQSLLADLGPKNCVVTNSISKTFMATMRIGWLVSKRELVRELAGLKRSLDLGCPPLMQGAVLTLFQSGAYDRHLERVRKLYRLRRAAMLDALERFMPPGVTWTKPVGSYNIWLCLPQGYSSIVLYMMAIDYGVSFVPGPYMDIDHRFVNCGRISYAQVDLDQIREGVELLAFAVKQLMDSPPGDAGLSGLGDFL